MIDMILLAFCSLMVLLAAFVLYGTLKELEIISRNIKSLNLRMDDLEDRIKDN